MDFRLTQEQEMLATMVSDYLAEACTGADLRRMADAGETRDAARWQALVELGLTGIMAGEDQGGVGLGPVEMALAATACGYAALPEPLVELAGVAVPLLAELGSDWLPRALAGEGVAVAHPCNPFVAHADAAEAVLVWREPDLHLVPKADLSLVAQEGFDPLRPLYRVDWKYGPATCVASGEQAMALQRATLDRGALFAAAQLLGLAQRAIDISVAYAKERQQFGKPIGSFQAIKHHLATAQTKVEFARPVVRAAAAELAAGTSLARPRISHAKLAAGAAADAAVHAAVQVHGAMGFSWEVDVHFLLKRTLALTNSWGTPGLHRGRVAAHVLEASLGPDATFGVAANREAALEPA